MADRRVVGLIFILLLIGGEANRVEQDIRFHSHRGLRLAAKRRAAAAHSEERSSVAGDPDEELRFTLQGLALKADAEDDGSIADGGEAARGMLQYQGEHVYAVMRAWKEAGSAQLDLYRLSDLDFVAFRLGVPLPTDADPSERLIVRHDDAVFMAHQKEGDSAVSIACERQRGQNLKQVSRDVVKLAPLESSLSIRIKGAKDWLKVGGPRDVAGAWLNAVRILQTVGTCVEDGSCLMQCTYVAKQDACNSEHFCSLERERGSLGTRSGYWVFSSKTRGRCVPKRGAQATRTAWAALAKSASKDAKKVKDAKCVLSCKEEWERSAQNVQLAMGLKRQLEGILVSEQSARMLPVGMAKVAELIVEEAELLSEEVANNLGTAFDEKRREKRSALRKALRSKGCTDLKDGSMQALIAAASRPDDATASSRFSAYAESCPWLQELEVTDAQRLEQLSEQIEGMDRELAGTEARTLREEEGNLPIDASNATLASSALSLQASRLASASLVEVGEPIVLVVTGLLELLAVVFVVAGIYHLYAGKQCRDQESFAHRHCSKKYLNMKSPCDKEIRWGVYYLVAGAAILTILVSLFTLGAGAAAGGTVGGGAAGVAAGGTGGGAVAVVAETGAGHILTSSLKSLWTTFLEQLNEKDVQLKLLDWLGDGLIGLIAYLWGKKSGKAEVKGVSAWELEELHLQELMYQRCMAALEPNLFSGGRTPLAVAVPSADDRASSQGSLASPSSVTSTDGRRLATAPAALSGSSSSSSSRLSSAGSASPSHSPRSAGW